VKLFELLRQGWPFFVQLTTAAMSEHKTSVESAARPGYPNFRGTRKFVEAHGRSSRRQAQRHLTLLTDAVTSHRKMPPCQDSIASIGKTDNSSHC